MGERRRLRKTMTAMAPKMRAGIQRSKRQGEGESMGMLVADWWSCMGPW